jgi:hypothetical protein
VYNPRAKGYIYVSVRERALKRSRLKSLERIEGGRKLVRVKRIRVVLVVKV